MIFIHGLGQNADSWKEVISCLSDDNHSSADLRRLLQEGKVTYEGLYNGFCKYLENCNQPANLCGLSLGAVLALNYAIDYPGKVRSLVLIAPQYKMPRTLLKFQNLIFRLMQSSIFKDTGFNKRDFISLCGSMVNLDFTRRLENISCRTLIVCGDKDRANLKSAKSLNELLSNSAFKCIHGAGHEVNLEAPKELAELISLFQS